MRNSLSLFTLHHKMNLDYLEIGSADFDLVPRPERSTGVTLEPVSAFYQALPVTPNWENVRAAIGDSDRGALVFSLCMEDTKRLGLPEWVRGCNCLDKPHPLVMEELLNRQAVARFIAEYTPVYTLRSFCRSRGIDSISHVKTDTEGGDAGIARQYLALIESGILNGPAKTYQAETAHMEPGEFELISAAFAKFGYRESASQNDVEFILGHSP